MNKNILTHREISAGRNMPVVLGLIDDGVSAVRRVVRIPDVIRSREVATRDVVVHQQDVSLHYDGRSQSSFYYFRILNSVMALFEKFTESNVL